MLSNTAALTHLPEALGRFLSTHPSIDVDLEEKPSQEIVAAVAAGLADFGIAADTVEIGPLETLSFRTDRHNRHSHSAFDHSADRLEAA
jgi:DNA-binding transcriptional LysR family regulator